MLLLSYGPSGGAFARFHRTAHERTSNEWFTTDIQRDHIGPEDHKKKSEPEILFDTRPPQVTEVTRTNSFSGTDGPVQPQMESAWGNPTRPYMETGWGHPVRGYRDQAQSSCIDLRVQRESQTTMKHFLESPKKQNKLRSELFPKGDDKQYQKVSQGATDMVKEQGKS